MTGMQSILGMLMALVSGARRDEGQTMAEYGLLLAFIALVGLVGVTLVGPAISTLFTDIAAALVAP